MFLRDFPPLFPFSLTRRENFAVSPQRRRSLGQVLWARDLRAPAALISATWAQGQGPGGGVEPEPGHAGPWPGLGGPP